MKNKLLILMSLLLFFQGCATTATLYKAYYDIDFSIETPLKKHEQGKGRKVILKSKESAPINFEDNNISITWYMNNEGFDFNLKNKTNSTIKVLWDDGHVFML